MPDIDLEALDAYLKSKASPEDCMLLSCLDGFLTGIVVGPEPIPTSEWMPVIWGGEEPKFESERQMRTVTDTIMGRHNEIAATMKSDPDSFEPTLREGRGGTRAVTEWATGFLEAIKLRREPWDFLFKHRRAKILLVPLVILGDDEDFFEQHRPPHEKIFYSSVPTVLKTCAVAINDFWRDQRPDGPRANPRRQRGGRRPGTRTS